MKITIGKKKNLNEVMAIVKQWPTSFTPEAYGLIRADFLEQKSFVSRSMKTGKIVGFVIFSTNAYEVELIWMAVEKNDCRHGVATNLVEEVISGTEQQKIIIAKVSGEKNKRGWYKIRWFIFIACSRII